MIAVHILNFQEQLSPYEYTRRAKIQMNKKIEAELLSSVSSSHLQTQLGHPILCVFCGHNNSIAYREWAIAQPVYTACRRTRCSNFTLWLIFFVGLLSCFVMLVKRLALLYLYPRKMVCNSMPVLITIVYKD